MGGGGEGAMEGGKEGEKRERGRKRRGEGGEERGSGEKEREREVMLICENTRVGFQIFRNDKKLNVSPAKFCISLKYQPLAVIT